MVGLRDAGKDQRDLPVPSDKARSVRRMFSDIAPRYDLLNHLLTLNMDRRWRRLAVDGLLEGGDMSGRYLDACAGTLDMAAEIAGRDSFHGLVVASDFARPMLERGRAKVGALPVALACADALRLPHAAGAFDGAIVGFGVRNFADLEAGLRELRRVVVPGGRLVVLELTTPRRGPLRALYLLYFARLLPLVGRLVSGHDTAYAYLPASVRAFPEPDRLARLMEAAGFERVRYRTLMAGIVAIHVGEAAPAVPS
jgi:demethylmenaquinone methyltransferase / 2-methoxy-6-polyprenyl-1,4-benzoquinol methylase